jgi:actin-like protein 6A
MTEADTEGADTAPPRDESKLYIGQHGPSVWREDMQIANPMSEGLSACGLVPPSLLLHVLYD